MLSHGCFMLALGGQGAETTKLALTLDSQGLWKDSACSVPLLPRLAPLFMRASPTGCLRLGFLKIRSHGVVLNIHMLELTVSSST